MSKWVRAGALGGARALVEEMGGDFGAIASLCGLRADIDAHPDLPIAASAVPRFLDLAAVSLACPSFGLRLGQRQDFSLFGPLGGRIGNATTVSDLVANLVALFPVHTHGAIVALTGDGSDACISYELSSDVHPSHRHVVELGFSILVAEIRRHRPGWTPGFVAFRHGPPRTTNDHQRFLGARPHFNAEQNMLLLDAEVLAHPLARAGAAHPDDGPCSRDAEAVTPRSLALDAERIVRLALPSRLVTLGDTARLLGLARRTLQRRLAAEGTSFEAIADAVRADLALAYLRDSDLGVAQIAETLQFSETSALSRAVRRWHGTSPRPIRRARVRTAFRR